MASRIQNRFLTSINLTIYNYYSLRKGNQNTFAFAMECLFKKPKFSFNLPSFKFIYCPVINLTDNEASHIIPHYIVFFYILNFL